MKSTMDTVKWKLSNGKQCRVQWKLSTSQGLAYRRAAEHRMRLAFNDWVSFLSRRKISHDCTASTMGLRQSRQVTKAVDIWRQDCSTTGLLIRNLTLAVPNFECHGRRKAWEQWHTVAKTASGNDHAMNAATTHYPASICLQTLVTWRTWTTTRLTTASAVEYTILVGRTARKTYCMRQWAAERIASRRWDLAHHKDPTLSLTLTLTLTLSYTSP